MPSERGDSLQVTHVVSPRDDVHGAPYRKGFHGDLQHGRESLTRQLSNSSEEPSGCRIKSEWGGKQQVNEIHCSVPVNPVKAYPLKPQDRVNTGREVTQ